MTGAQPSECRIPRLKQRINRESLILSEDLTILDRRVSAALSCDIGFIDIRYVEEGVSILLCEQTSVFALALSDRAYIIEKGAIRHEGPSAELPEKTEVMRMYLAV